MFYRRTPRTKVTPARGDTEAMHKHAGNAAPAHTWEFEGAHGRWHSFHPAADAAVKAALQQGLQQAKASFINDRTGRQTKKLPAFLRVICTKHRTNQQVLGNPHCTVTADAHF